MPFEELITVATQCAQKVHTKLGTGFDKKVYENCLKIELVKAGCRVKHQHAEPVIYDGIRVGEFIADLVVDDHLVLQVQVAHRLESIDEINLANCLNATRYEIGLLVNFGFTFGIKRKYRS